MADKKATGRNKFTNNVPVGLDISPVKFDTEGTDAHGRSINLVRDDNPTRIDHVTDELYYLGWAEYGSAEDAPVWKIRRIQKVGTVWEQKYARGGQDFRYRWTERSVLPYA